MIAASGVAGGALWIAPSVLSFGAAAAASGGPVKVSLWKSNNAPPNYATVCTTGPTGNATRGEVTFTRTETPSPLLTVAITITSGPSINGDGTCSPTTGGRIVEVTQATASGCLSTGSPSVSPAVTPTCFTAPASQTFTTPILPGARYFAVRLLQSGGGGTDTYWSERVDLP